MSIQTSIGELLIFRVKLDKSGVMGKTGDSETTHGFESVAGDF